MRTDVRPVGVAGGRSLLHCGKPAASNRLLSAQVTETGPVLKSGNFSQRKISHSLNVSVNLCNCMGPKLVGNVFNILQNLPLPWRTPQAGHLRRRIPAAVTSQAPRWKCVGLRWIVYRHVNNSSRNVWETELESHSVLHSRETKINLKPVFPTIAFCILWSYQ